jgi:hypothetical protein
MSPTWNLCGKDRESAQQQQHTVGTEEVQLDTSLLDHVDCKSAVIQQVWSHLGVGVVLLGHRMIVQGINQAVHLKTSVEIILDRLNHWSRSTEATNQVRVGPLGERLLHNTDTQKITSITQTNHHHHHCQYNVCVFNNSLRSKGFKCFTKVLLRSVTTAPSINRYHTISPLPPSLDTFISCFYNNY